MWTNSFFSSLPVAVKRVLLWGIPSLAILGLVGIATKRFLTYSQFVKKPLSSSPPQLPPVSQPTFTGESPKSQDSGIVEEVEDVTRNHSKPSTPRNSASGFKYPSHRVSSVKASSNVEVPLYDILDNEDFSAICPKQALVHCADELQFEVSATETDVSGDAYTSLSYSKSESSPMTSDQPTTSVNGITSTGTSPSTQQQESKESASEMLSSGSQMRNSVLDGKDRMRIQLQLPRDIVGRFIGKQGRNIKSLMQESGGTHIFINQKSLPKEAHIVPCTIQGTVQQVDEALKIIEAKFPEIIIPATLGNGLSQPLSMHSHFLAPLCKASDTSTELWDIQLSPAVIPSGTFTGMISYIEDLTHVWLVACEKNAELDEQHQSMSYMYCYAAISGLDSPQAKEGDGDVLSKFCAVRVSDIHWLRGRVTGLGDGPGSYEVQLMDYGSFVVVPLSAIRPLMKDHCKLPIQAFRAHLDHLEPTNASSGDGLVSMQHMVEGVALEIHVTDQEPLPLVKPEDKTVVTSPPPAATTTVTESSAGSELQASESSSEEKMQSNGPRELGELEEMSVPERKQDNVSGSLEFSEVKETNTAEGSGDERGKPGLCGESVKDKSPDMNSNKSTPDLLGSDAMQVDLDVPQFHMAPHMPVVELYMQVGSQSPIFINRELVELGYALWIEGHEGKDT